MSQHNKTYFTVKLGTIVILLALAFYAATKTSEFIKEVQAKKAQIDSVANAN